MPQILTVSTRMFDITVVAILFTVLL